MNVSCPPPSSELRKSIITNSGSWRFFDSQSTETNGDDAKATLTLNIVKTTVVKQKNKVLSKVFI